MAGFRADSSDVPGNCPMRQWDRRRTLASLAVIFQMGLLFWLSSISDLVFFRDVELPTFATWFIETFRFVWGSGGYFSYGVSFHPDNLLHKAGQIVLYGLLGVSLYIATGRSLRWTLIIVAGFAFSDEWHQSLVPGRSGRFFDVVLDVVSAWVGVKLATFYAGIGRAKIDAG